MPDDTADDQDDALGESAAYNEVENQLAFERDLAGRQAKIAVTDMKVARMALEENRPLEALRQLNEAIDRRTEELDALDLGDLATGGNDG